MDIISTTVLLFMILDPLGNLPIFISALKHVPEERRIPVLIRELVIALAILLIFLFIGDSMLSLLSLEQEAVSISGGVILFIIGLKMVFPSAKGSVMGDSPDGEPFIVPLAVPLIAGPSILATLILLSKQHPDQLMVLVASVFIAWLISSAILILSDKVMKLLGKRGVYAIERLMGMILIMLAVQMLINGISSCI